ncbi:hypothetical protein G3I44_03810 [Halogeometricum borinquense]|uniref:Uncharacterized protein n=1 Tax=Halogeometricum borinquense TaxID=60847 RepID=A0A6C0UDS1_9EURY|nr:hypothetical protein [Halogeometricum borinquense]QIB73485.1 hypothetical protein G3I44_03810 [Halogeometricum borinquense]
MTDIREQGQFAIKWAVEPDYIDRPYREAREELFEKIVAEVEASAEIDTKHPDRQLSGDLEGVVTVGTLFASNPQLAYQIFKIIIDNPKAVIENVGFTGDVTVFETPFQFDIDFNAELYADIDLAFEYKGRKVWIAEEKPEELQERNERRLVEKINEGMDEELTYEEWKEKYGSDEEEEES